MRIPILVITFITVIYMIKTTGLNAHAQYVTNPYFILILTAHCCPVQQEIYLTGFTYHGITIRDAMIVVK